LKYKYFILYLIDNNDVAYDFYLKGKSALHLYDSILQYSDGVLHTNKGVIYTMNFTSAFLRQIPLWETEFLNKKKFAVINENRSYNLNDLEI
jgi:hypothetical protein